MSSYDEPGLLLTAEQLAGPLPFAGNVLRCKVLERLRAQGLLESPWLPVLRRMQEEAAAAAIQSYRQQFDLQQCEQACATFQGSFELVMALPAVQQQPLIEELAEQSSQLLGGLYRLLLEENVAEDRCDRRHWLALAARLAGWHRRCGLSNPDWLVSVQGQLVRAAASAWLEQARANPADDGTAQTIELLAQFAGRHDPGAAVALQPSVPMPPPSPGVWIGLDQLLSLPLPDEPLASLWRELLRTLPPEAGLERQTLQLALQSHELRRLQAQFASGELEAGFRLLDRLAPDLGPAALAHLLNQLMPRLHHILVELAGTDPEPEVVANPRRAECLWLGDQWMRRLEQLPGKPFELRPLMAEHICRYAAVAWLAQPPATARWRTLDLLQRLLRLQPEARSWAVPALRDRLLEAVSELNHGEGIADPLYLAELLGACAAMEHDPQLTEQARGTLQLAVFRGRAALDVWQNLVEISPQSP